MSEEVAIYGITGALGHEVLQALEVDHEGIGGLVPVAGPRSAGRSVRWRGATLPVIGPGDVDPSAVDVAVFATRADVVAREAPRVLQAGGRIIDASGVYARTRGAPIVWPRLARKSAVELDVASAVALPSAIGSTLAPLLEAVTVARAAGLPPLASCDVVALVAASGAGRRGIDALSKQAVGMLNFKGDQAGVERGPFPRALAFDILGEAAATELVLEERVQGDLAALVPDAGVRPNVSVLWAPAFSGLVLSVTLRFAAGVDRAGQSLLQTVAAALASHPDVHLGERDDDEDPIVDDDAGDDDGDADEEREADAEDADAEGDAGGAGAADAAGVLGMRDAVDQDEVIVAPPVLTLDGAVRLTAFADPLRRTAVAVQRLVSGVIAELEADA